MRTIAIALVLLLSVPLRAQDQPGEVVAQQKISALQGGLAGGLGKGAFGVGTGALGDVDGDGIGDLAVGAMFDDTGGFDRGAVYVLMLDSDGTVKSQVKITSASLIGDDLDDFDYFGSAVAGIGDLDQDGVPDVAVCASGDDDGLPGPSGNSVGAVWILFLDSTGNVKNHAKISATQGGLAGPIAQFDSFAASVAGTADLDGDGVRDIAVGAASDDDGAGGAGAIHLLYLNPDGSVKAEKKISATQGGFGGTLGAGDGFGSAIGAFSDLDGNGSADLAVGALGDGDGAGSSSARGAVWILFLDANQDVIDQAKISDLAGGFTGELTDKDKFGQRLAVLGDVDGDGVQDLAVGVPADDDGGAPGPYEELQDLGAVWVLYMNSNGGVKSHVKISALAGGLAPSTLKPGDRFGGVAPLGDFDGDGTLDLAVGAQGDDDGGGGNGAVYILSLHGPLHGTVYGCGINTPGSLLELGGEPAVGSTWTLGVENPLGTQPPGSLAFLAVAISADPSYPCGTTLPGWGMASAAAPGELLLSLVPPNPVLLLGPVPWQGVGSPAPLSLALPPTPALAGQELYLQGALLDATLRFALTDAIRSVINP